jgi:hypothetical protein
VSRLRVLESGSIVYEKDGIDILPAIQSPWLKLNCYGPSRIPDCYLFKIPFNSFNDESKQFYNLLSDLDKMFDKKDGGYRSIINNKSDDDDSHPDFLVKPFRYNHIEKKIKSSFFFNNNYVRTKIDVETNDDVREYFQPDCEFRFIMSIKSIQERDYYDYSFYSIRSYLEQIEIKSERTELNSIRIRREALLVNLANLHTLPMKGVINVKLGSSILLIDNNPEHPDKPSSECPISKEDFANKDDVIIFNRAKHGFKQIYKITSLQAWINHKPIDPTDPTTREPITKQNVERYTLKFM